MSTCAACGGEGARWHGPAGATCEQCMNDYTHHAPHRIEKRRLAHERQAHFRAEKAQALIDKRVDDAWERNR